MSSTERYPRLFGIPCWSIPVLAGFTWLLTLMSLMITWLASGTPRLAGMALAQDYPYISDIGRSAVGRPLAITGSVLTIVLFGLAYAVEGHLRQKGLLLHWCSRAASIFYGLATTLCVVSASAMLLAVLLNTAEHPEMQKYTTVVFTMSFILSALCTAAEKKLVADRFPHVPVLRLSYQIKLWFVLVDAILVAACLMSNVHADNYTASVSTQWLAAFMLAFYILSFTLDLLSVAPRESSSAADEEKASNRPVSSSSSSAGAEDDGKSLWDAESIISVPSVRIHVGLQQFLDTSEKSAKGRDFV